MLAYPASEGEEIGSYPAPHIQDVHASLDAEVSIAPCLIILDRFSPLFYELAEIGDMGAS